MDPTSRPVTTTTRWLAAATALGLSATLTTALSTGASAAPGCESYADPVFSGTTPTGPEVLGYEFGSQESTSEEISTYLAAVDEARDDVQVGQFATSYQRRPLEYAVVGSPADVAAAQQAADVLRDPSTTGAEAQQIASSSPAIVWMAGNVHGNEESGGDAALQMLYELSDRSDCAATLIRDNTVIVIIPTQNPDGREMDTRRNHYGFDLNRDWFARTQTETDGKVSLLWEYPPVLVSDNHEMGGTEFFFPPNADPVHHEVADRSVSWINDLYGGAMAAEFDRNEWPYFNYSVYDLLYMGYGDTVPTTGLLGAGMTYEKGNASPIAERTEQQFAATWASMYALADNKPAVLRGWAANYRQALSQGRRGALEPNQVFAPDSTLELQVPNETIRQYFIRNPKDKATEVQALLRRLQRMDIDVRQLRNRTRVADFRAYGDATPRAVNLPAGTYVVSMAQAQKHWIQAMLGEDSYVPFPYFYDVTAWNASMLFNVAGGRSAAPLRAATRPVPAAKAPQPPSLPAQPGVGLWLLDDGTAAYESEGWTRWLLEQKWHLPYRNVTTPDITEGALAPLDVLLVPNGNAETAFEDLGPAGRAALREWLADGGRFVGWRSGTELAARLGLTTARLRNPDSDVPGSLIRVSTRNSGVTSGVGGQAWNFYEYDPVMTVARPESAPVFYPNGQRFFVSGYQRGADELRGTAAVVAERYADGQVVLFAGDPNFRAFTDGTQRMMWNAIFAPDRRVGGVDAAAMPGATDRAARDAAALKTVSGRALVTVPESDTDQTLATLRESGIRGRVEPLGDGLVRISWAVPDEDGRPQLAKALDALQSDPGTEVLTARVP